MNKPSIKTGPNNNEFKFIYKNVVGYYKSDKLESLLNHRRLLFLVYLIFHEIFEWDLYIQGLVNPFRSMLKNESII